MEQTQTAHSTLERGQALLIVVLVMVVVLTIGLSVATRNILNLRTATEEENTKRAFSAAEAGIEQALKSTQTGENVILNRDLGNKSTIKEVNIESLSGANIMLHNGNPILKDDAIDIWLSDYGAGAEPSYANPWPNAADGDGLITLYWGNTTDTCDLAAALSIVVLTDSSIGGSLDPQITHYAVDPCSSRRSSNNFTDDLGNATFASGTVSQRQFAYTTQIEIPSQRGIILRVVPLYTSAPLAVSARRKSNNTPLALRDQGTKIESTGESGTTQRKIVAVNGYPKIPVEFFPYIIFSPED